MIKFSAGYIQSRQATVIGLGLVEHNLNRMLGDNDPIYVKGSDLDIPEPGADIMIVAAKDRAGVEKRITQAIESLVGQIADQRIKVMHVGNMFYLTILSTRSGKMLFLITLDDCSYRALKNNQMLSFRSRTVEGQTTSVEVAIFYGKTNAMIEDSFYRHGLIGKSTKIVQS